MLAQQLLQRRVGLDQGRLTQGPGQGFGVGSVAVSRSNAARVETATDPSRRWRTAVGRRARSDRAQGRLVQIAHMQPKSLQHHCAKQPVLYALEVNQGWFERNDVKLQTKVLQPSDSSR